MRRLAWMLVSALWLPSAALAVSFDWVEVQDAGNAADPTFMNDGTSGYGSVPYNFRISKLEVTNTQYAAFLNAVAATDTNALYNPLMQGSGIKRNGSAGSYTYVVLTGTESRPVAYVSFFDTLRFANWLHNGQPSGVMQTAASTEDGAYTLLGANPVGVTRNLDAAFWLPSEDEWYKAAYFDAVAAGYDPYPFADGMNVLCETPPESTTHSARCAAGGTNATVDVGSYATSLSAYGTLDQGGNIAEWNESAFPATALRSVRGGAFDDGATLAARTSRVWATNTDETDSLGFRIATPEPGSAVLVLAGVLGLAAARARRA